MKLLRLALVLVFPFALVSQTKEITNEEIWNFEFSSERLEEIHPLTTVSQYTVLEVDRRTRTSKVVAYDYATAEATEEIVNSATSALHIACKALELKKGDYLWTSAISFVASANCGIYCGANIDFVDILYINI